MRPIATLLASVVLATGACAPSIAKADEFTVALESRYLDTTIFNDVYSDKPSLQFDATFDLNKIAKGAYVSAYAYTGFDKPFGDSSSEYGLELGGEWDIADSLTFNLAGGRYANYEGRGFDAGDWYGKVSVSYAQLTVSASVLNGEDDTVLFNGSYELQVGERLSITPSVAYLTAYHEFNPAIAVSYRLLDGLSLSAKAVAPKDGATGKRKAYGAVRLSYDF